MRIQEINGISTASNEGQYLMAALALIITTSRTDKTPVEVLDELTELKDTMYPDSVANTLISNGLAMEEHPGLK